MPKYDYECEACGAVIEVQHAMSAPGPQTCACGAEGKMHRLLSAGSGLIFKGSGFYITDYAKKSSPAPSSSSPSGAAESKPAGACCPCGAADTAACPAATK